MRGNWRFAYHGAPIKEWGLSIIHMESHRLSRNRPNIRTGSASGRSGGVNHPRRYIRVHRVGYVCGIRHQFLRRVGYGHGISHAGFSPCCSSFRPCSGSCSRLNNDSAWYVGGHISLLFLLFVESERKEK